MSGFSTDKDLPEGITPTKAASMGLTDIVRLRNEHSGDMKVQKALAPYDHMATAREAVTDDPLAAIAYAVMIPGYAAAKAAHALPEDQDTTPPSMDEILGGFRGIAQGLGMEDTTSNSAPNDVLAALTTK